jgi:hypothetical protein
LLSEVNNPDSLFYFVHSHDALVGYFKVNRAHLPATCRQQTRHGRSWH